MAIPFLSRWLYTGFHFTFDEDDHEDDEIPQPPPQFGINQALPNDYFSFDFS